MDLAAALDSADPIGNISGRGPSSLLDRFIFEPFWQRTGHGIRFQFIAAHPVKSLPQPSVLNLDGLSRSSLCAVSQLLSRSNVSFGSLYGESCSDLLGVSTATQISGHGKRQHFAACVGKRCFFRPAARIARLAGLREIARENGTKGGRPPKRKDGGKK
jgi:hypothetical protein